MKRKITALCACLALALCLLPLFAQRAEAADLDYIASYDISVTPNTDDGSLDIRVQIEWQVLDEGPVEWVKIGLPNGSIRNETALTANIDRLSYDNSYMYVYFVRGYDDGETILFAYSWTQEYMYNLDGGAVTYDYTPGWFDEARVGQMTLTWTDPDSVTASSVSGTSGPSPYILERENLSHGERLNISVRYDNWPTAGDRDGYGVLHRPCHHARFRRVPGRLLRAAVCVRQQPVVPSGAGRPPEARQRRHEAPSRAAPVSPRWRLRRRQPRRRVWRRRLRWGWRTLRLRQQLRLCVRVCLRRRRPRGLQRQEPLRCHPPRRFPDQKSGGVTCMIED